ncbi:hypothetical protein ABES58_03525 [Paenibacillus lautus]|uniref:hypothetical protein n=1 Tax=Paenibacillus lautus TaxID=1401 RepID=UPI003D2D1FC1
MVQETERWLKDEISLAFLCRLNQSTYYNDRLILQQPSLHRVLGEARSVRIGQACIELRSGFDAILLRSLVALVVYTAPNLPAMCYKH